MRNFRKVNLSVDEVQANVLFSHSVTPCIHPTYLSKESTPGTPRSRAVSRAAPLISPADHRILDKRHLTIFKT